MVDDALIEAAAAGKYAAGLRDELRRLRDAHLAVAARAASLPTMKDANGAVIAAMYGELALVVNTYCDRLEAAMKRRQA